MSHRFTLRALWPLDVRSFKAACCTKAMRALLGGGARRLSERVFQHFRRQRQYLTGPIRVRWFPTFGVNVSQIYDGDGEPVELKIELVGGVK